MTVPPRLCLDCDRPIPRAAGSRCQDCRARREARRPSARARGYGRRWEQTRARFLNAEPMCRSCGRKANEVDHIDGQGPNGPAGHNPTNLRALCKSCHSRRTAYDQPGGWHAGAA